MLRNTLASTAAALLVCTSAFGLGRMAAPAHALAAAANYSGTIAITDWQVPDGGYQFGGAASNTVVNHQIDDAMTSHDYYYNQDAGYFADMVKAVPTPKQVGGNTVVSMNVTPGLKWSDGSPITAADWLAPLWIWFSPDVSNTVPYNQIVSATYANNVFTLTWKGAFAPALDDSIWQPLPWELYQKNYGAPVKGLTTDSWTYAKDVDPKTGVMPASLYASSGLKKLAQAYINDYYNDPAKTVWSGPYKLSDWVADQRYTLVPNPYYTLHGGQSHPLPAKIQFVVVSEDEATLTQDLTTSQTYDQIDKAEDFQLPDLPTLKQSKYNVQQLYIFQFEHLEVNGGGVLKDVRLRQALQYAINKTAYLKALFPFLDNATIQKIALGGLFPVGHPFYDGAIPGNLYNPTKAKALLAAAGYSSSHPLHIDFYTTNSAVRIKSGQLLQRLWSQVGIVTRLNFVKSSGNNGFFSGYQDGGVMAQGRGDVYEFAYEIGPDPDGVIAPTFDPSQIPSASVPNGGNYARVNDPKVNSYINQGRAALDKASRTKVYNNFQQYFAQEAYWINLYSRPDVLVTKGTIGNFKPNLAGDNSWNTWEWYRAGAS